MTEPEHPLLRLARLVRDHGGEGMEWRERPFGRGAEVRVWLPDLTGALVVYNEARWGGLGPEEPVPYLPDPYSVRRSGADGWQVAVTIPLEMVASARALMQRGLPAGSAAALEPAERLELGPSTGPQPQEP